MRHIVQRFLLGTPLKNETELGKKASRLWMPLEPWFDGVVIEWLEKGSAGESNFIPMGFL